jgi:hypothetical protein
MIASTIGRTFLNAYNNKTNRNLSAKEFFVKEFFEIFYNHPKYMQWVTNSPFVQELSSDPKGNYGVRIKYKENGKTKVFNTDEEAYEYYKKNIETRDDFLYCHEKNKKKISKKGIEFIKNLSVNERRKKLNDFIEKAENVASSNRFDGSIVIGFPASELDDFPVYSGQVTDMDISNTIDDIYLSWIGSALGIGVEGGYTFYLDEPDLLISVYDGWKVYREILNDTSINHKARQIDTWNGQWLAYLNDRFYRGDNDYVSLNNHKNNIFKVDEKTGVISVDTIPWSKLVFSISKAVSKKQIVGFIGTFSKDNKSLGFFPFSIQKVKKLIEYYKLIFGEYEAISDSYLYENIFGKKIKQACEFGSIGLKSLEPKDIREYFGKESNLKLAEPKVNRKKGESDDDYKERKQKSDNKDYRNIVTFRTYKTWLLAMITKNKEENLNYSEEVAKALLAHKQEARVEKKFIEEKLFKSRGRKQFLHELYELLQVVSEKNVQILKDLRDRIYSLSDEDYQYLILLIKFDFAYQERLINQ